MTAVSNDVRIVYTNDSGVVCVVAVNPVYFETMEEAAAVLVPPLLDGQPRPFEIVNVADLPPNPPAIYTFYISVMWGRMTDEEAETFDAAESTTAPLRLRKQFGSATNMKSDSELFTWVRNILVSLFGATRADELLAEGYESMAAVAGEVGTAA